MKKNLFCAAAVVASTFSCTEKTLHSPQQQVAVSTTHVDSAVTYCLALKRASTELEMNSVGYFYIGDVYFYGYGEVKKLPPLQIAASDGVVVYPLAANNIQLREAGMIIGSVNNIFGGSNFNSTVSISLNPTKTFSLGPHSVELWIPIEARGPGAINVSFLNEETICNGPGFTNSCTFVVEGK